MVNVQLCEPPTGAAPPVCCGWPVLGLCSEHESEHLDLSLQIICVLQWKQEKITLINLVKIKPNWRKNLNAHHAKELLCKLISAKTLTFSIRNKLRFSRKNFNWFPCQCP